MRQLADSFALAVEARTIGTRLIADSPMFAHLGQARLLYLSSQPLVTLRGAACNACIVQPSIQGPLKRFFDWVLAREAASDLDWEEPDFVILFDAAAWSSLDAVRKERLVYHELRHVAARENEYGVPKLDAEGRPMLKLVPHDFEFFQDEVATYGIDVCGLEDAAIGLADGAAVDRTRHKRRA